MGTFYNGANCDIYIGKSAGKKLMEDISNAKKNIKIISPFLSPLLVKELISIREKGIEIGLITTDKIEDFKYGENKNLNKLIIQNSTKDYEAEILRNHWLKLAEIFLYCSIAATIISIASAYTFNSLKPLSILLLALILYSLHNTYVGKAKKKRIYIYHYRQLFPFKVYINKYKGMHIHAKLYIIDDQIAYLGSINFTSRGTKYNYETRVRITDSEAVKKIVSEFLDLFNNKELPERDIQLWGKELYPEPIN